MLSARPCALSKTPSTSAPQPARAGTYPSSPSLHRRADTCAERRCARPRCTSRRPGTARLTSAQGARRSDRRGGIVRR